MVDRHGHDQGADGRGRARFRSASLAGTATAGALLACASVMIATRLRMGRAAGDEINFHEPAIRRFYDQWPVFDFSDYLSATTPGYHLLMAAVMKVLGPWEAVMRVTGLAIGCLLAAAVGAACARVRGSAAAGVLLALPLAMSMYVQNSAAYLLPDNLGWLGVLALVLVSARMARGGDGWIMLVPLAGVLLAVLVFVRQIHIWTAGLVWVAAWLGAAGPERDGERIRDAVLERPRPRMFAAVVAGLATLPAALELAWFARRWGGLTPPSLALQYPGANPAAPAFILSLVGVISIFYAAWLWRPLAAVWRERRWLVAAAAGLGLVAAVVPETTYNLQQGRYSGLWAAAKPELGLIVLGRTSIVLTVLAPLGAVALVGWARRVGTRLGTLLLAGAAGFIAAQAASFMLYQRYSEPMVLMALALCAAVPFEGHRRPAPAGENKPARRWRELIAGAGPLALAACLGLVTAASLWNDTRTQDYFGFEPGQEAIRLYFSGRDSELPRLPRPERPIWPQWLPWGKDPSEPPGPTTR